MEYCPFLKFVYLCNQKLRKSGEPLDYVRSRFVRDEDIKDYWLGYSDMHLELPNSVSEKADFLRHFNSANGNLVDKILIPNIFDSTVRSLQVRSYTGKKFYWSWFRDVSVSYRNILGMWQAMPHIVKNKRVFLVESFFDMIAIRPWLPEVVSTFTAKVDIYQLSYLKRYCDKVYLCFNDDSQAAFDAGKYATKHAENLARSINMPCSQLKLPKGINDLSELRGYESDLSRYLSGYIK